LAGESLLYASFRSTLRTVVCSIGTLELNLQAMPHPAKKAKRCTLDMLPPEVGSQSKKEKRREHPKLISLFELKRARGFWPCYRRDEMGVRELTVRTRNISPHHVTSPASPLPAAAAAAAAAAGTIAKMIVTIAMVFLFPLFMSVRRWLREHISETACPNFINSHRRVACGRGSVLLWRRRDMLCTSGSLCFQ